MLHQAMLNQVAAVTALQQGLPPLWAMCGLLMCLHTAAGCACHAASGYAESGCAHLMFCAVLTHCSRLCLSQSPAS